VDERSPSATETNGEKPSRGRINLEKASILLIDNTWGVEILTRIFTGFGARRLHRCKTVSEATDLLAKLPVDLIVTEALIEDGGDIYEFVRTLRQRADNESNRFAPVILLSAHTATNKVAEARDCGANFFVAKPLSPKVIMDRVLWVANGKRQYLETETYAGPDRRFRDDPPPGGIGRRRNDPKPHLEVEENNA